MRAVVLSQYRLYPSSANALAEYLGLNHLSSIYVDDLDNGNGGRRIELMWVQGKQEGHLRFIQR